MKLEDMFSTFKNSKGKTVGEIFLYGPIAKGGMWESDENSCKNFLNQIREMEKTCSEIQVRINSEGGSVFEGVSISNQIKQCSVPVHAVIDGLCASIATVIASACTTVKMASNGIYMVHSPLSQVSGNAHDMKEMAKILDKIEEAIIETYVEKCKDRCDRDKIKELLNGETEDGQGTWLTAKEAKKYGFVDEIGHELAVAAQIEDMSNVIINDIHMDLSGYQNLDKVREMFENTNVDNKTTQEIEMSEKEKFGSIIDSIAASLKAVFAKDEIEPEVIEPKAEQDSEITNEEEPVIEEQEQPQEENLEEEIQEEDAEVQDEPEVQEEPVAEPESGEAAQEEIQEPQQEEPIQEEIAEETDEQELEDEESNEPDSEIENSIIPEVENSVDLVAKIKALEIELNKVKAENATKEAKAILSKEVQNKFKGVPGKLEDKVNMIYNIQNSSLEKETQDFILNGLSLLSEQNLRDCKELGADGQEEPIDENDTIAQAKALAEKEGISEAKAVAVIKGGMKLSDAKKGKK